MLQDGKYFSVAELACHDGTPYPDEYSDRLVTLIALLDKIRETWGSPIKVVSGYRTPQHNAELAQDSAAHQVASGSQHVEGRAADIRPVNGKTLELFATIKSMYGFGELQELGGLGFYPVSDWVHVDTFQAPDGHLRRWQGT